MIRKCLAMLAITLLFAQPFANAQEKIFTPEDVVGLNPALYPSGFSQLQWAGDEEVYSFTDKKFVMQTEATTGKTDTVFSLSNLNKWLSYSQFDTLTRLPQLKWINPIKLYFISNNKLYLVDLQHKSVLKQTDFPKEAENIQVHQGSMKAAYTLNNNLFLCEGTKHTQITFEEKGIVCGQSVHRNEFGIDGGIFWSPDGSQLAFYRMDERMVASYPIVDIEHRIAEVEPIRYPMAGETSHQVTLGVFHTENETTTYLTTGAPVDQYLTAVSWAPDNQTLCTGILNRDQNHLALWAFNALNGEKIKLLFEESDPNYVEPLNPLFFLPDGSNRFVWVSRRDGFNHLYLYDFQGNILKQLTTGNWEVSSFDGFSADGKNLFYVSNEGNPIGQQISRIELSSGKTYRLSATDGVHRSIPCVSGKFVLDVYSSPQTPRGIVLIPVKKGKMKSLKTESNLLKEYRLGSTTVFTLKANDGSDLYCRMITPPCFDSTKTYPVIVYVYGGPHSQLVTAGWLNGANLYLNYLAQKGYIVFTLDNHGTSNRGKAFEQAIFRNLGKIESADQLKGIQHLTSLPYVDASRIGIDGWSYGGFMTIYLKLTYPELFKVAVAGGPVIDWKFYEVMYGERYMDTPQSNPDGYNNANLLLKASQLKGKLLIIHDTKDNTVVWQNSLLFLRECVDQGVQLDYFVYPGHEHNVRGKDRAHLIRKITGYFDDNL